jgi:hypothetical protein
VNTRCNVESPIRKRMKMKRERGKPIMLYYCFSIWS